MEELFYETWREKHGITIMGYQLNRKQLFEMMRDFRLHIEQFHKPNIGGPGSDVRSEGEQLGNEAGATKPVRLVCEHPQEFIEDDVTMGVSIVVCKRCGEVL